MPALLLGMLFLIIWRTLLFLCLSSETSIFFSHRTGTPSAFEVITETCYINYLLTAWLLYYHWLRRWYTIFFSLLKVRRLFVTSAMVCDVSVRMLVRSQCWARRRRKRRQQSCVSTSLCQVVCSTGPESLSGSLWQLAQPLLRLPRRPPNLMQDHSMRYCSSVCLEYIAWLSHRSNSLCGQF